MYRSIRLTALVALLALLLAGSAPQASADCVPAIVFDSVPPVGSSANLTGRVTCANPADYKVAVYINVGGWWTKPYFAQPLTTIQGDGTWVCDITTGGADPQATDIAAFLVPNGYTPPAMSGGAVLPAELYARSAAYTAVTRRAARMLIFSGYTWEVKYAPVVVGPGPNYFSDDPESAWVDQNGYLHLKITNRGGIWYCAEVVQTAMARYGTHTIELASRVDTLDRNAVLGYFTWDDNAPQYNYREIDIEFSRWAQESGPNAQYVIQPWNVSGNRHQFPITLSGMNSKHQFDWRTDRVTFDSWDDGGAPLQTWTYTNKNAIPPAGGNIRLNLWLVNGAPPSDAQEIEVVIKSYTFTPADPWLGHLPVILRGQ